MCHWLDDNTLSSNEGYNSILLTDLEFNFAVRDFLYPWHCFLIDFNDIRKYILKVVLRM